MEFLDFITDFGFCIVLLVEALYLFLRYFISKMKNPNDKTLQKKKLKLEKKLNNLLEEVNELYGKDSGNENKTN